MLRRIVLLAIIALVAATMMVGTTSGLAYAKKPAHRQEDRIERGNLTNYACKANAQLCHRFDNRREDPVAH